jgi:hypothetical protein
MLPQAAKSDVETQKRMALLKPRGTAAAAARPRADVVLLVKTSAGPQQVSAALRWSKQGSRQMRNVCKYHGYSGCTSKAALPGCKQLCLYAGYTLSDICCPVCCCQVVASGHLDEVQGLLNGGGAGEHCFCLASGWKSAGAAVFHMTCRAV